MIKRESIIFLMVLVILSLLFHYDNFFSNPLTHITSLPNSSAYGLGFLHPLIFSLLFYILLLIPRTFIKLFKKNHS